MSRTLCRSSALAQAQHIAARALRALRTITARPHRAQARPRRRRRGSLALTKSRARFAVAVRHLSRHASHPRGASNSDAVYGLGRSRSTRRVELLLAPSRIGFGRAAPLARRRRSGSCGGVVTSALAGRRAPRAARPFAPRPTRAPAPRAMRPRRRHGRARPRMLPQDVRQGLPTCPNAAPFETSEQLCAFGSRTGGFVTV